MLGKFVTNLIFTSFLFLSASGYSAPSESNREDCSLSHNTFFWERLVEARRQRRVAFDRIGEEKREVEKLRRLLEPLLPIEAGGAVSKRKVRQAEYDLKVGEYRLEAAKLKFEEAKALEMVAGIHADCLATKAAAQKLLETYRSLIWQRIRILTVQEEEAQLSVQYETEWFESLKKANGAIPGRTLIEHETAVQQAVDRLAMIRDEIVEEKNGLAEISLQLDSVAAGKVDIMSVRIGVAQ